MAKRIRPGEVLQGIHGGSWNEFADASDYVEGLQGPVNGDRPPSELNGGLPVLVKLHENLPSYSVVGIDDSDLTTPEGAELGSLPRFDAQPPKADKTFAITRQAGEQGADVRATLVGVTWVKVDIKDEADETCGPIDDETGHLESGSGVAKIQRKETGTGVKWAVVQLGGSSPTALNYYRALLPYSSNALNISPATFDDDLVIGGDLSNTVGPALQPGSGDVYKFVNSVYSNPATLTVVETLEATPTTILNWYTKALNPSGPGKALIVQVINDSLFNVDCEEVTFETEWPPPEEP